MKLNLCPEVDSGEEAGDWRFCGVWARNRWEWTCTELACMHYKITTVGFYEAMGPQQVQFILNQT